MVVNVKEKNKKKENNYKKDANFFHKHKQQGFVAQHVLNYRFYAELGFELGLGLRFLLFFFVFGRSFECLTYPNGM